MNSKTLNVWLAEHDMTQARLAEYLGITSETIGKYKRSGRFPKWFELALGISKFNVVTVTYCDGVEYGDSVARVAVCECTRDVIGALLGLTVVDGDNGSFVGFDSNGDYFSVLVGE